MKHIPRFRLVPEPADEDARRLAKFRWAGDDVGSRHQLGGEPTPAISESHWPRCPDCRERMSFYGQLDSLNDDYCVADAGVLCIFFCFDCNEVVATVESG